MFAPPLPGRGQAPASFGGGHGGEPRVGKGGREEEPGVARGGIFEDQENTISPFCAKTSDDLRRDGLQEYEFEGSNSSQVIPGGWKQFQIRCLSSDAVVPAGQLDTLPRSSAR